MEAPIGTIVFFYHLVVEESKRRRADEEAKQKKKQEEERRKKMQKNSVPRINPTKPIQNNTSLADISMEDLEDELS